MKGLKVTKLDIWPLTNADRSNRKLKDGRNQQTGQAWNWYPLRDFFVTAKTERNDFGICSWWTSYINILMLKLPCLTCFFWSNLNFSWQFPYHQDISHLARRNVHQHHISHCKPESPATGHVCKPKNYGQDENKPKMKVLELRKSCLWTFIAGWMMRYTGRTATKYTGVGDEMCHRLPPNSSNQFCETHVWTNSFIWLVVYLPLWKIWLRQLGWLFTIYGKIKFHSSSHHQPVIYSWWYFHVSPFDSLSKPLKTMEVDTLVAAMSSFSYSGQLQ